MDLLVVVKRPCLVENWVSPSSVLSRDSKSSIAADGCKKEVNERLKNFIDDDDESTSSGVEEE